MSITLERAIELIKLKREAEERSHLKQFEEEPDLEKPVLDDGDRTLLTQARTTRFPRRMPKELPN